MLLGLTFGYPLIRLVPISSVQTHQAIVIQLAQKLLFEIAAERCAAGRSGVFGTR